MKQSIPNNAIPVVGDPDFMPVWAPLEARLTSSECAAYMFMGSYMLANGLMICTYKHCDTREYLNLSLDGRSWEFVTHGGLFSRGGYREVL